MPAQSLIILLLAGYLIVVILLSGTRVAYLPGRGIYLLRALFPSWRFFEDLVEVPMLYYRISTRDGEFGEWIACMPKLKRSMFTLFLNPEGNFIFACHALLHQVQNDIEEVDENNKAEFVNSVSYGLLKNLVVRQIKQLEQISGVFSFQFKVTSVNQANPDKLLDDILVSPVEEDCLC